MHILNTTHRNHTFITEKLLISVHYRSSRQYPLHSTCRRKIALKPLNHTLIRILLNSCNHQREKFIPFILRQLFLRNHSELPLSLMRNKRLPQLFRIIIDVFRKIQHYGYPNIIRSNLHISMIVIRLEKSCKKTIVKRSIRRRLTVSLISQCRSKIVP